MTTVKLFEPKPTRLGVVPTCSCISLCDSCGTDGTQDSRDAAQKRKYCMASQTTSASSSMHKVPSSPVITATLLPRPYFEHAHKPDFEHAHKNQPPKWIPLVKRDSVAAHRGSNKYLLSGFRACGDNSWSSALFRLHGQTVNIWSHLAGASIFVLPGLFAPSHAHAPWMTLVLRLHSLVALACGWISAAYHVVESWSPSIYSQLLALDYTFAYIATVSHAMLIACYETHEHVHVCWPLLLVLSACAYRGSRFFLVAQAKSNKTDSEGSIGLVMGAPLLLVLPLVLHALVFQTALAAVLVRWMLAFFVSAVAWMLQLPERFFAPGTFDYIGNSHNVMHIGVLFVYLALHSGVDELIAAAGA